MIARWKRVANATWSRDAWQATLSNRCTSGYNGYNGYDRASHARSARGTSRDLAGSCRLSHALELTLGVKNRLDREPPFSNRTYTFQSGYDPRYTAPTGASCLAASTTAGRPAAVAGKPVDGCPAARSGSPARFHRRPDLAGCWVPGAMQPITPLAPHPFAQEDTA